MKLEKVKSWWYQLQRHIRLDKDWDLLVMDADKNPTPYLFKPSGLPRAVLAYISIGEAESYRAYWPVINERMYDDALIIKENPEWPECWSVRFWMPDWNRICIERVKAAQAAGFSGVYLDKVDVFEDIKDGPPQDWMERKMVQLILDIGHAVPSMDIVIQNGEALLAYPELHRVLSGVAVEDLILGGETAERAEFLRLWEGPKFAVEYGPVNKGTLKNLGFIPLIRNRELD